MGIPQTGERDLAIGVVTHIFTATGPTPQQLVCPGNSRINITIGNTGGTFTGSIRLRRSFNAGVTWHVVANPDNLVDRVHTAPVSYWQHEPETGVLYDLECTAFTTGPIPVRLSL
jgi:hypothetical protein